MEGPSLPLGKRFPREGDSNKGSFSMQKILVIIAFRCVFPSGGWSMMVPFTYIDLSEREVVRSISWVRWVQLGSGVVVEFVANRRCY